jgi:hypothetical protein
MSQYLLASHVYLCVTDDHAVLLDLKRDKYVAVGQRQMRALERCVKGWPAAAVEWASPAEAAPGDAAPPAKILASGMLTTDERTGKEARPVSLTRPERSLQELDLYESADPFGERPQIRAGEFLVFLRSCAAARAALRFRPIASIVAGAAARKSSHAKEASLQDARAARRRVAAYLYMRPLVFAAMGACLYDSLTLVHFLSHYRIYPDWVFGVQTKPFAAHCWVQQGDVVFNDTPEHVRRYTPILSV